MPLNTAKMTFETLVPVEVEVDIGGKPFLLVECSQKRAAKWKDSVAKAMKMEDGKVSGIDEIAKHDAALVASCLFDVSKGKAAGERMAVSISTVEEWPASIVSQLFDRAKEISRLEPKFPLKTLIEQRQKIDDQIKVLRGEAEDDLGNLSDGTTTCSAMPTNGASN